MDIFLGFCSWRPASFDVVSRGHGGSRLSSSFSSSNHPVSWFQVGFLTENSSEIYLDYWGIADTTRWTKICVVQEKHLLVFSGASAGAVGRHVEGGVRCFVNATSRDSGCWCLILKVGRSLPALPSNTLSFPARKIRSWSLISEFLRDVSCSVQISEAFRVFCPAGMDS